MNLTPLYCKTPPSLTDAVRTGAPLCGSHKCIQLTENERFVQLYKIVNGKCVIKYVCKWSTPNGHQTHNCHIGVRYLYHADMT